MQTSKPSVALPSGSASNTSFAALRSIIAIIPGVESTWARRSAPRPASVRSSGRRLDRPEGRAVLLELDRPPRGVAEHQQRDQREGDARLDGGGQVRAG